MSFSDLIDQELCGPILTGFFTVMELVHQCPMAAAMGAFCGQDKSDRVYVSDSGLFRLEQVT